MPDIEQLKHKMRTTWMTGDFGKIAQYSEKGAEEFVGRLNLRSGTKVLDIACGTGNLAIPAARAGAEVTGVDIAANLLQQARERALSEGLRIVFDEGDAERLPYADQQFDVVMTMFGAMFAPRPEMVSAELKRVCRSGGMIAMANWTREGFVGKMFAATSRHVPPPPGVSSPLLWGDEDAVRGWLADGCSDIALIRRTIEFDYPFSPAEVVTFFRKYYGPTSTAFSRLDTKNQAALATDLEKLWTERNQGDGEGTQVSGEYLEVLAVRA